MLPLQGLRIVELSLGPISGLATMILADFGAEVVRVEPTGGDPAAAAASARLWRRGKLLIELDLANPDQLAALRELIIDSADALVSTLARSEQLMLGLDAGKLRQQRPDLIHASIAGLAESGPYAEYPAAEGLAAALAGRMMSFEGAASRPGPVFSALQVGVHATAQSVASGLLAALHARQQHGTGAALSTSLLRGMLPYDLSGLQTEQLISRGFLERPGGRQDVLKVMPRIYYHAARTRDGGWIQFGNLLPHLQQNFFRAAGIEIPEGGVPTTGEELEDFRNRMLEHIAQRDLDEWMRIFIEDGGVVAHPYQTTQQALDDPDLSANGHVVDTPDGRQLGLVANLTGTPGRVGAAPVSTSLAALPEHPLVIPAACATSPSDDQLPLSGITVVEAATIIAAPLGAATLADLGARVIKLEPLDGDPFRQMMAGIGAAKCNTGKESICLDLKSADAQRIAGELIAGADIFIHNYRPGVPERLGLGYELLQQTNPGLVYLSANGYGPAGPGALRPSTHPIPGAALGGVVWQMGGLPGPGPMTLDEVREITRRLFRANEVNPDPNTSMVIATAATLGLLARDFTGQGQKILVDMFGANAYANWDDFLSYPGKPDRPAVDAQGYGLNPGYRLYQCADGGWIFLYAANREALATLGATDHTALEAVFAGHAADYWTQKLCSPELCCVRADAGWPADFLLNAQLAESEQLVVPAAHAQWGEYLRHGPMVRFGSKRSYPGASVAGDSTRALLGELGYGDEAINALLTAGVVSAFTPAA